MLTSLPAEAVDEGSVTAWATFGAAMADATDTLSALTGSAACRAKQLTQATQEVVDSLRRDAR